MLSKGISKPAFLFGLAALTIAILWAWASFGDKQVDPDQGTTVANQASVEEPQNVADDGAETLGEDQSSAASVHEESTPLTVPLQRNAVEQSLAVALADEDGKPVEGEVWLLARNASLEERLDSGRFAATYLFGNSLLAHDLTTSGGVDFPIVSAWQETPIVVFAAAPGFAPQAVKAELGMESQQIMLKAIEPISVYVVDTNGKAVANTACWITPMFTDWRDGPEDWLERLALRGYMEQAFTDANGHATFRTCYPDSGNSIKVYPEPPLAVGAASFCEAGQEVHLSCAFGFAVSGQIFNAETGEPLAGAFAIMTEDSPDGSRTITSQVTKDDGRYRQEALPAGAAVLSIHAKADGYAMQRQRIFSPQSSSSHKLDFFLQPAEGLELKLRTSWGDPILDSIVQLRLGRNNMETDFQSTDENGIVRFPAELQAATPYECLILIGSNFWALPDATVRSGKEEILVEGLSQVLAVVMPNDLPDGFTPTTLEWTSLANENQGVAVWESNQASPLLPVGAGCLAVTGADGRRLEMLATLEEGVQEQIHFISHPARLTFEWTGNEAAYLSLRSNMAWDWFKLEEPIAPGLVELDLWQGTFSLMVDWDGGSVSLPAVQLDSGLTDLGPLGWHDSAGVQGRVHDASDRPLAGVEVNLFSMEVGPSGFASTDAQGNFVIGGMSPGAYSLQVTGGKAYGGSVHESQQEVFLAPGAAMRELDIQLEMNASRYLEGRVAQAPPAGAFAFSAADGQAQLNDVLPSGNFLLPQPTSSRWIGVGLQERGRVLFTMKKVDEGTEFLLLDAPSLLHSLRVVDEQGAPWVNARVYAFVAGASLGSYSLPDLDGTLLLEVSSQVEANLQFRLPDGRAVVHSLQDLLTLETLAIPRHANFVELELVDDQGHRIPGAAAMHYGVGDVFYGNGKGQVKVPTATAEKPYLLMAPGHLSIWDDALQDHQVTLPALYSGIRLIFPKSLFGSDSEKRASWIQVRPLNLPASALAIGAFDLDLDGSGVTLPPVPAGDLQIQVFSATNNPIGIKVLTLSSGSLSLNY